MAADAIPEMWHFVEPASKLDALTSRVVAPEETERRLRLILPRIPVTRIADLTPLDRLGLPVYSATTPLARDLTTHMGKGLNAVSARVSALMEAVERVSAETAPATSLVRASFEELSKQPGSRPVDPQTFHLPSDSAYAPERPFFWMRGYDLLADRSVLLPADLALSPPCEGILRDVDTNGLASGNTHLEAVIHALSEVIERDVQSQLEFTALFADPEDPRPPASLVDLGSLPEQASRWIERLHSRGLEVILHETTGEIGVPVFRTLLMDTSYPAPGGELPRTFLGFGCALDAEAALLRSLSEAIQALLALIQGARDSFNVFLGSRRNASRRASLHSWLAAPSIRFSHTADRASSDLREDLAKLLERVSAAGFENVIAVDLTRPDWGVPAVRVRIPGISCFSVNRRRVDWRCLRYLL